MIRTEPQILRLATVTEVVPEGVKLHFAGEIAAREKVYKSLGIFDVGARVCIAGISGTAVVLGVIGGSGGGGADVDGWIRVVETWTYANPTIITVPSGALSKYRRGNAVKFTQDNIEKQFYIANVTDDSLTLTGGNNFILTDNGIEDIYYSFIKPLDFQNVFSWEPTYGASGSMTFTSVTTHFAFFKLDGDYLDANVHATGTTGGTASNTITVSLPLVVRASFASCGIVTDPSNTGSMIYSSPNAIMSIRKYDSSNFGLGTGRIIVAGLKAKLL